MYKRLIPALILAAYGAILIKIMVLKEVPLIKIGSLMLNFGGTDAGHAPNFVPFTTIVPYLFGYKGLIIAGINLVGNIILLVPLGFLLPLVYRSITVKKALGLAVVTGLAIEGMQVVLRVGIFDIDDVILNALGFMIGYGVFVILAQWVYSRSYIKIVIASLMVVAAAAAFYSAVVYPITHQTVIPVVGAGRDLCGGTGGTGEVVGVENNSFSLQRNDGRTFAVVLAAHAEINTPAGPGLLSDVKIGDRVTLVGGPNPDGSFTADAVFVCAATSLKPRE